MGMNNTSLRDALARGYSAYRAGRFAEAEQIYKAILQAVPRCVDALHLLGLLKVSTGFPDEADSLLKKALMIEPRSPDVLNSRANVLQMLGRHEDALACCTRALQVKPDFPEALNNRGNVLHDLRRFDEALASLDRALALRPDYAKALNNRGIVLLDLKRPEDALSCFERALALDPDSAEALNNRGNALHALKQPEEALAAVERALALAPDYAKALHNRGRILHHLERPEEALKSFDRALAINPLSAETLNCRGAVLHDLERFEEALRSTDGALQLRPNWPEALVIRALILLRLRRFSESMAASDRVLASNPDDAAALNNRGSVLRELNRWEEALTCFDRALALNDEMIDATFNYGLVLQHLQRPVEALERFERVLTLKPDLPDGLFERANALRDQQKYDAALAGYDRTVSVKPDFAAAHWNESLTRLLIGDFQGGWAKHDWRWRLDKKKATLPSFGMPHAERPLWQGKEDLAGKTVLVHGEQGFGDVIQFCRYASLMNARGARVVLEVQPELVRLMRTLAGVDVVIAEGQPPPPFDLQCPVMDLPGAFRTTVDTIPADVPYLAADPALVAGWRERLSGLASVKIGLVWGGNSRLDDAAANRVDLRRSIPMAQLAPLGPLADIVWISLQKGTPAAQAAVPPGGMTLIDWTSQLNDFADTAALVQCLDLVISVDTSVAHLVGALGKPLWLLNRFDTCWRWLLDREDTPWYPTMRIFRQPSGGDWGSVVERVAAELPRWIAERGADDGTGGRMPGNGAASPADRVDARIAAARS